MLVYRVIPVGVVAEPQTLLLGGLRNDMSSSGGMRTLCGRGGGVRMLNPLERIISFDRSSAGIIDKIYTPLSYIIYHKFIGK